MYRDKCTAIMMLATKCSANSAAGAAAAAADLAAVVLVQVFLLSEVLVPVPLFVTEKWTTA
eukprot:scaffold411894_cov18-Prasinocladus_malaysianus.AAC.1